jgi:hypothetical protein
MNDSYKNFKKKARISLGLFNLPKEIYISTMTVCCKINTIFNVENIAKYIELSHNDILSVSYGNSENTLTNRSLLPKKYINKKVKKNKKAFFNQVSMYIYSPLKSKIKMINLKIFSNGAFQMTGCQSLDIVFDALVKIISKLSETKAIIKKSTMTIEEKPFSENPELINMENLKDLSIAMINSNFVFPTKISRPSLYNVLKSDGIEAKFDPTKHASVNIKYDCSFDKKISILVFEGGAVLITGAKNCEQVNKGYMWINKYLLLNIEKILKHDIVNNKNKIFNLMNSTDKNKLNTDL